MSKKKPFDFDDAHEKYEFSTETEKQAINAQMKANHRKSIRRKRFNLFIQWLKQNVIAIVALLIAIAAFIKSFF